MNSPDAFNALCPTRQILDRIADKWTVLLLGLLAGRTMRFNELRRGVDGLSQKVLSQTLKSLERDGLVTRAVYPTVPVTVEYAITDLGRTLAATLEPLRLWAESHMNVIEQARADFDRRQQAAA
ncbi:winged helix-turn-helix transcriptional regulator [Zavarzinia aquatilis]|uniref:Transcriptional regulator n=1 Tax=Zavarzinia aquatilis TaxID=2211142 RepID=A0A317EF08_9PROT|nr:helix-turn-helix domain-containing protein [Zavarzinia aquatilis]PWR25509.1 transcriptional regulator [Zavarzinia aquatilis]